MENTTEQNTSIKKVFALRNGELDSVIVNIERSKCEVYVPTMRNVVKNFFGYSEKEQNFLKTKQFSM